MGVGAALVMPLAMAVLPSLFGEPQDRIKAIGIVSAASALGMPLGPILGGWLLDHFWWGSIFLVNIPMVGIGITACVFLLPETRDPSAPRVDAVSTTLTAVGLGALIYAIIEAPGRGWGDPLVLAVLATGAVLLALLVLRERKAVRPMLDMSLLRQRPFLLSALAATLVMFVMAGLMFILPGYLQAVLGNDAFGTGVRMLPMMGGLIVAAKAGGPVTARFGARATMSAGLIVLAFAALLGSRTTVGSGYGFTALWLSVAGLGFGFAVVPAMDAALGTLPADRAGSGSGLLMTVRQTGSALGIALLGSLLMRHLQRAARHHRRTGRRRGHRRGLGRRRPRRRRTARCAAARGLRRRGVRTRHEPGPARHRRHRTGQRPAGRGVPDRRPSGAQRAARRGRLACRCLTMTTMAATPVPRPPPPPARSPRWGCASARSSRPGSRSGRRPTV